jgi:hypothetical protein
MELQMSFSEPQPRFGQEVKVVEMPAKFHARVAEAGTEHAW